MLQKFEKLVLLLDLMTIRSGRAPADQLKMFLKPLRQEWLESTSTRLSISNEQVHEPTIQLMQS